MVTMSKEQVGRAIYRRYRKIGYGKNSCRIMAYAVSEDDPVVAFVYLFWVRTRTNQYDEIKAYRRIWEIGKDEVA